MVNAGKEEAGYWCKKPGKKALFMSLPARQPTRKEPVRSKPSRCYKANPVLRCSRTWKYIHAGDEKCMNRFGRPQKRSYEVNKAKEDDKD